MTVDFWVKLTCVGTLIYCETAAVRSVAFEVSRDDTIPARVSHSGTGDLEDVIDSLRYTGYEVLIPDEENAAG
jgi:hypothetical protein